MLLEMKKGLETMTLNSIFGDCGLLEAETGDLLLQIGVLLTDWRRSM